MTADEIKSMNEAVFATLEQPTSVAPASAHAVNDFLRSMMYHKFTGMPKRGFLCRIMPPIVLLSRDQWIARGVDPNDLVGDEFEVHDVDTGKKTRAVHWKPWWERGDLFYEIAEERLDREDYHRRLAARKVEKFEWRSRESSRRRMAKLERERYTPGIIAKHEAFAYNLMGELVGMTLRLAERNDRGRTEDEGAAQ